jgi:stage II sporulation protein M
MNRELITTVAIPPGKEYATLLVDQQGTSIFKKQEFRKGMLRLFTLGVIAFLVGILISSIPIAGDPNYAYGEVKEMRNTSSEMISVSTGGVVPKEYIPFSLPSILMVFINNVIIAVIVIVSSVYIASYFPYMAAVVQGIPMGILVGTYMKYFTSLFVIASIIPHGIIEVPAILIAGACGLYIGNHKDTIFNKRGIIISSIALVVLMLICASFIEVFITPHIQKMVILTFGVM